MSVKVLLAFMPRPKNLVAGLFCIPKTSSGFPESLMPGSDASCSKTKSSRPAGVFPTSPYRLKAVTVVFGFVAFHPTCSLRSVCQVAKSSSSFRPCSNVLGSSKNRPPYPMSLLAL